MSTNHAEYSVLPFPRERQVIVEGGRIAAQRHTVHGLIEVDVTEPRRVIREHKARTGETLSFTAFVVACLGKAVDENKMVKFSTPDSVKTAPKDEKAVELVIKAEPKAEIKETDKPKV